MHEFPGAARAKGQKLGGFKEYNTIPSQFWRRKSRIPASAGMGLGESLSRAGGGPVAPTWTTRVCSRMSLRAASALPSLHLCLLQGHGSPQSCSKDPSEVVTSAKTDSKSDEVQRGMGVRISIQRWGDTIHLPPPPSATERGEGDVSSAPCFLRVDRQHDASTGEKRNSAPTQGQDATPAWDPRASSRA